MTATTDSQLLSAAVEPITNSTPRRQCATGRGVRVGRPPKTSRFSRGATPTNPASKSSGTREPPSRLLGRRARLHRDRLWGRGLLGLLLFFASSVIAFSHRRHLEIVSEKDQRKSSVLYGGKKLHGQFAHHGSRSSTMHPIPARCRTNRNGDTPRQRPPRAAAESIRTRSASEGRRESLAAAACVPSLAQSGWYCR